MKINKIKFSLAVPDKNEWSYILAGETHVFQFFQNKLIEGISLNIEEKDLIKDIFKAISDAEKNYG